MLFANTEDRGQYIIIMWYIGNLQRILSARLGRWGGILGGGGSLWGRGARLHAISILTVQIHSGATGIDHEIIKII